MRASGFVLAGGASSRMGRNKALLPYRGTTLARHIASVVKEAAGSVALIGDPARLAPLGLPAFADRLPSCGPVGGIYTALSVTNTEWNLVVACDMPAISLDALRELLRQAETATSDCVAAAGPGGEPEPLCAVYHVRCLPVLARAIGDGRYKLKALVREIGAELAPVPMAALANVNTPEEWSEIESKPA